MKNEIQGKVYVVGDNIDTDVIIPARHLNTMDPEYLGKHAMEDLDPKEYPIPFLNEDKSCDYKIIIARKNFGCGSSREHAPIALHAAGIEAVVASSFARIYYRNSVNGGIILSLEADVEDPTKVVSTGDTAVIKLDGEPKMTVYKTGEIQDSYPIKPFGPVKDIIEAGGLTPYNKKKLRL